MKRVLMVDDDPAIRRIVRHHLTLNGFEVVEAEDGVKALEIARRMPVDLILLDLRMPVMNGYEVAEQLQEDPATADIPIVVCSVVADEAQAKIVKAKTFLLRPFGVQDLVNAVRRAVA